MEEFRSKSYHDGRSSQLESYSSKSINSNPTGLQDLRCYSASYASSSTTENNAQMEISKDVKFKKGKSTNESTSKGWSFNDPELQRKKRVASYKVYTVEGKVKGSFKKSFKWLKEKCTEVVYRWR